MDTEVEPLKPGLAGVEQTVAKITRLIREGAANPYVIEEARRVVRKARPADTQAEWRALWDYITGLQAPFPYRFDPVDVELLHGAHVSTAGEDCDGFTVKCGALLEALGYPVTVEVMGSKAPAPGQEPRFHHVYLRVFDPRSGRRVVFDPVVDSPGRFRAAPGMAFRAAVRREYPVAIGPKSELAGLGFDARAVAKVALSPATRAAAVASRPAPRATRTIRPVPLAAVAVQAVRPVPVTPAAAAPVVLGRTRSHARSRRTIGYTEGYTDGYGSGLGFSFSDIVDGVVSVSKKLDFTDPRNSLLRSAISAIPVVGSTVIAAGDTIAAARKAVTKATGIDPAKLVQSAAKPSAPPKPATLSVVQPKATVTPPKTLALPAALKQFSAPKGTPQQLVRFSPPGADVLAAQKPGLSTGAKVAIGVGGAAAVGALGWLAFGRKGRRR